jgi:hypothetical protein
MYTHAEDIVETEAMFALDLLIALNSEIVPQCAFGVVQNVLGTLLGVQSGSCSEFLNTLERLQQLPLSYFPDSSDIIFSYLEACLRHTCMAVVHSASYVVIHVLGFVTDPLEKLHRLRDVALSIVVESAHHGSSSCPECKEAVCMVLLRNAVLSCLESCICLSCALPPGEGRGLKRCLACDPTASSNGSSEGFDLSEWKPLFGVLFDMTEPVSSAPVRVAIVARLILHSSPFDLKRYPEICKFFAQLLDQHNWGVRNAAVQWSFVRATTLY